MKNIKFFEDFESSKATDLSLNIKENHEDGESKNYMFFQNLNTLKNSINDLLEMDQDKIDQILSDGHGWALDHIATSVDDVEEVYHFLSNIIDTENDHDSDEDNSEEDDDEDEDEDDESPINVNIEGSNDDVEIETGEEDE